MSEPLPGDADHGPSILGHPDNESVRGKWLAPIRAPVSALVTSAMLCPFPGSLAVIDCVI